MAITAEENRRLGALLVDIKPDQWSLPTDCTRWDVRAIVVHLIATAEAQASAIEFVPQAVVGSRLTKQIGGIYPVDGLNEAGLRARRHLKPDELPKLWSSVAANSLRARRRMPKPIRALPLLRLAPKYWKPLGYLYDIGFTVTCGCTESTSAAPSGAPSTPQPTTMGRIVADIIAEWATTHKDPFTLKLTGPAGGTYSRDPVPTADRLEIDAIDCCRILSGRGTPVGVLHHPLLL
ncbi:MAG TPA: maleylpyruvate isomerase N-terminal domain-containing protein [Propionibacteriaceae bacterium]|nr:maleylpyruvate isomerase N-terminal domain-containing protein [Propionibacteriaceae bacterium]